MSIPIKLFFSFRSRGLIALLMAAIILFVFARVAPVRGDDPGYALEFDGVDDYVLLGETDTIMGTGVDWENSKTVGMWLKPTGTPISGSSPAAIDLIFGDGYPRMWGMSRGIFNGLDRIWLWNRSGSRLRSIGVEYAVDEWVQITMVHNNGVLTAYKNGFEVGSIPSGLTTDIGDAIALYVGGFVSSSRNYTFEGEIDEVRVWNVGLDEATIQNWTYTEVNNTHPSWGNLAAYYQMSDGVGPTVTDDSDNSNTGTMYGGMGDANWVLSGAFGEDPNANQPSADGQAVITDEDMPVDITLTGSDPNGDPLSYIVVGGPSSGVLSGVAPDLTYTPNADFNGGDSFNFKVNDGVVDSPEATVTITVSPVNDQPVAADDAGNTDLNTAVVVDVLNNDGDVDGDGLAVDAVGAASDGTVVNNGVDVTYTPDTGFIGTDVFSYTVADGQGGFDNAQVTVMVNAVNTLPVAADDVDTTDEDTAITVDVLANDGDVDGDGLSVSAVGIAANGTVVNNGSDVTYTPAGDFYGIDVFDYNRRCPCRLQPHTDCLAVLPITSYSHYDSCFVKNNVVVLSIKFKSITG